MKLCGSRKTRPREGDAQRFRTTTNPPDSPKTLVVREDLVRRGDDWTALRWGPSPGLARSVRLLMEDLALSEGSVSRSRPNLQDNNSSKMVECSKLVDCHWLLAIVPDLYQ